MDAFFSQVGNVYLPGDVLTSKPLQEKIRIGNGLIETPDQKIQVRQSGKLSNFENLYFIENKKKRYLPRVGDMIIGTITEGSMEFYKLDIGSSSTGYLNALSFDGASKRNKPNLKTRDIVYCRVSTASRDLEPELTCLSLRKGKDWVTGESEFGELKGGHLFDCSLDLAKTLLDPKCYVLKAIGERISFEMAIGMNGKVWLEAEEIKDTISIANLILQSEKMSESDIKIMIQKHFKSK